MNKGGYITMYDVIIAIISAAASLIGTVITVVISGSVTQYRIKQLEQKVEKHNNVLERTYKLESKVETLEELVIK